MSELVRGDTTRRGPRPRGHGFVMPPAFGIDFFCLGRTRLGSGSPGLTIELVGAQLLGQDIPRLPHPRPTTPASCSSSTSAYFGSPARLTNSCGSASTS